MHGDGSPLQTAAVAGLEEEREMLESRGAGVLGSMEVPCLLHGKDGNGSTGHSLLLWVPSAEWKLL